MIAGRRPWAGVVGAAALATGALGAWSLADRGDGGGRGDGRTITTAPGTAAGGPRALAATGADGLATLPAARRSGRILYTTPGCRLGLVDLATGRVLRPRPDVSTCRASAAPLPDLAISTGTGSPGGRPLRVGIRASTDRSLGSRELFAPVLSRSGTEASCVVPAGEPNLFGVGTVVVNPRVGAPTRIPGCSPAWWRDELVRIDRSGRVVGLDGSSAIEAPAYPKPSALGASADGSKLIVIGEAYETGAATALVFDRPGERATARFAFRVPLVETLGGRQAALPNALISDDGAVAAAQGTDGLWLLARVDGAVPPAVDAGGAPILDVAFAPDGRSIAVAAAGRIVFLDPLTLAPVAQLPIDARSLDWER